MLGVLTIGNHPKVVAGQRVGGFAGPTIYALPSVNNELSASLFNWSAWPNMADRGKPPQLKK